MNILNNIILFLKDAKVCSFTGPLFWQKECETIDASDEMNSSLQTNLSKIFEVLTFLHLMLNVPCCRLLQNLLHYMSQFKFIFVCQFSFECCRSWVVVIKNIFCPCHFYKVWNKISCIWGMFMGHRKLCLCWERIYFSQTFGCRLSLHIRACKMTLPKKVKKTTHCRMRCSNNFLNPGSSNYI